MDSMLPWVCTVTDNRRRQFLVITSVTPSAAPRVPLFCSCRILSCDLLPNKRTAKWTLFVIEYEKIVAPIVCQQLDVNIRDIGHVLFQKRNSRCVCTGIFCYPKLLSYGHSKLETVGKFHRISCVL